MLNYNNSIGSGAMDVVVTKLNCGCIKTTDFHLKISKLDVLMQKSTQVDLYINGKESKYKMRIGSEGIAFFEFLKIKSTKKKHRNSHRINSLSQFMDKEDTIREQLKIRSSSSIREKLDKCSQKNIKVFFSLCGGTPDPHSKSFREAFFKNQISEERFSELSSYLLNNPDLIVKINNEFYKANEGILRLHSIVNDGASTEKRVLSKNNKFRGDHMDSNNYLFGTKLVRSQRPPHDFFDDIGLLEGSNSLEYSFKNTFGRLTNIKGKIFYYPCDQTQKFVISDIDGTITKSDVFGFIMPFIGMNWVQSGIVSLFKGLVRRGYKIIYLTSRNVELSQNTRNFLESIIQNGEKLPDGPLFMSTDSLWRTLKSELIDHNPYIMKIRNLRKIKEILTETNSNPFFAGFGNRGTDVITYLTLGIAKNRIYTINTEGEIFVLSSERLLSYKHLSNNLGEEFPNIDEEDKTIFRRLSVINHKCYNK